MLSGIKFVPRDELQKGGNSDSEFTGSEDERKKKDLKKRKEKRRGKKRYSSSEEETRITKRRRRRDERDKRKKRKYSSDDSDEEEETEEEEKGLVDKASNEVVRKEMGLEWMLKSASKMEKKSHQEEEEEDPMGKEVPRSNPRELNPHFKDNGSGYPDEEKSSKEEGDTYLASSVVGDGGASWRLKALKRAKEQAAREGRKLEEVAGERWGTLGNLVASVATARAAPSHVHLHAIRRRKAAQSEDLPEEEASKKKHENRDYLRKSEMRRPRQDSNLSWRRNNKGQGQNSNLSSENKALVSEAIAGINKFDNDGSFLENIRLKHTTNVAEGQGHNSNLSSENKALVSEAIAGINKFDNDGSFLENIRLKQTNNATEVSGGSHRSGDEEGEKKQKEVPDLDPSVEGMSANQIAARVLQLRMKGKHEEADRLSKQKEVMVEKEKSRADVKVPREGSQEHSLRHNTRYLLGERRREEDSDMHLASSIMQNKKYSASQSIEDEYEYDGIAPSKKKKGKKGEEVSERREGIMGRRQMLTQKERCLFCFENPSRPKHLVVSIANFTYLMLPQWEPVVPGHCLILPLQHEAATRNVDKNVWEEIRNFKKCLLRMFAKQEKDAVFLETVIGLSKQRRHCLIECIPIPSHLSNAAPMYFKKAIDEAEDEWGQHEVKKLIPTSGNLRSVIPANFAYFHVEFGLDRGFVHVIDDEANFSSGFGLNVLRGMLQLPEEDMHRKRRYETVDRQREAVAMFAKDWEPFDWTRQLE